MAINFPTSKAINTFVLTPFTSLSEAEAMKRRGKQAVYSGYSNAFSSMLSGASNYALYSGGFDLSAGAKKAGGQ